MASSTRTSRNLKRSSKVSMVEKSTEKQSAPPAKRRGRPKIVLTEQIFVKKERKSSEDQEAIAPNFEGSEDLIPASCIKREKNDEILNDETINNNMNHEDPLNLEEPGPVDKEDYKCKVIKEEKLYNEVVMVDSENCTIQTGVFIKQEPGLERDQLQNDTDEFIENDPIYGELHSDSIASSIKEEPTYYSDENSSSTPECIDLDGNSELNADKNSVIKKSNFLDILKNNLKRKSEMHARRYTKRQKVGNSGSAGSSTSKVVPALGKLRNIIGSNFKKLNLNLNETADTKPELELEKNEDAFFNNSLNSDKSAYDCPKCGASFKWKTTLKFHMFNHLEDKAVECDICFKLFLSTTFLLEHKKKSHITDRNFSCNDCSGKFESEASLTCHMITHEKKKQYVCNVCKEKFTSLYSLNSHKSKHSAAIKYECKPCDVRFKSLKTLSKHIDLYHKDELKEELKEELNEIDSTEETMDSKAYLRKLLKIK